jgi:hypothetical protein
MPETGMPHYRIYPLNPAGRIGAPVDADCPDDSAAILAARDLDRRLQTGCEVWELTRFLGRFHFYADRAAAAREA